MLWTAIFRFEFVQIALSARDVLPLELCSMFEVQARSCIRLLIRLQHLDPESVGVLECVSTVVTFIVEDISA
jgi:hypothetical protein